MMKHMITSPQQQQRNKRQAPNSPPSANKVQKEYKSATSNTWFAIGQCALTFQLYSLAVQAFDSSLRHIPGTPEVIVGLSQALKLQDENIGLKQSTELLVSSIQRFPTLSNDPKIWKELAETHLSSKQYEEAHQAISRGLSVNQTDPELLLVGAECLIKLNNFPYASHTLHTILQNYQNKPLAENDVDILRETHYKIAYVASLENNLKLATEELQAALSLPPHFPSKINEQASIWTFLITVRERAGDLENAIKIAQDSIQQLGHLPRLLLAYAYLLLFPNSKFYEPLHAISLLESAVNQARLNGDEGDFLIWYLLGKAHSLADSPREAYDSFQIALRIGPGSPLPWLAVGSLYLRMGQLPDALAAYSQAARLLVDDNSISSAVASATAWDGLSCVYERCDDQAHDAADACLRAAACFKAAGDLRAASQSEQRAHSLSAAARGEAPVPSLRGPPETPIVLLRELIISSKKIEQPIPSSPQQQAQQQAREQAREQAQAQTQLHVQPSQAPQPLQLPPNPTSQQPPHLQPSQTPAARIETPKQFHHIPLPRGSLASRSNTPDLKDKRNFSPQNNESGYYYQQLGPVPPQGPIPQPPQQQSAQPPRPALQQAPIPQPPHPQQQQGPMPSQPQGPIPPRPQGHVPPQVPEPQGLAPPPPQGPVVYGAPPNGYPGPYSYNGQPNYVPWR